MEQVILFPQEGPPLVIGFGTLNIAANPFALVRIDGKEVESAPVFKRKLPTGTLTVTLIHPDTGQ